MIAAKITSAVPLLKGGDPDGVGLDFVLNILRALFGM